MKKFLSLSLSIILLTCALFLVACDQTIVPHPGKYYLQDNDLVYIEIIDAGAGERRIYFSETFDFSDIDAKWMEDEHIDYSFLDTKT